MSKSNRKRRQTNLNAHWAPRPRGKQWENVDAAERYARDVISGKVPASKLVRLCVERQLRDLKRARDDKAWPYRFDGAKAERFCRVASLFPHVKGKWAAKRERIKLQDWQAFGFCVVFGWVRRSNGMRRFTEAYWEIPRKNGKSVMGAVLGNYMFLADGEFGAEVYSGATSEKQAWEIYRPAKQMMEKSLAVRERFGVEVWAKHMVKGEDLSRFEPIIGKPGDGASPSCALIDEFHEHDTPDLYDTMTTGLGARDQPLVAIFTTAGVNLAGPCYLKHQEVEDVLKGVVENDQLFGIIYGIDLPDEKDQKAKGDDWADPKALVKANPNYGVGLNPDILLAQQRRAVMFPHTQNAFKTKHLNIWCNARTSWMPLELWQLATDRDLKMTELRGEDCWLSFDLASKLDLAALVMLFSKLHGSVRHAYAFAQFYLPERTAEEPGKNQAMYERWAAEGLLTLTPGAVINYDVIKEDALAWSKEYNPAECVFDPFNAAQLALQIGEETGMTMVEFAQRPSNFAVPMDDIIATCRNGAMHHDGNPMLQWCVNNTAVRPAMKGLWAPIKSSPDRKIDGAVALAMAWSRMIAGTESGGIDGWLKDPVSA